MEQVYKAIVLKSAVMGSIMANMIEMMVTLYQVMDAMRIESLRIDMIVLRVHVSTIAPLHLSWKS